VITAVNATARREGLRSGMALADARAIFPGLQSRPAEPARDRALLTRLARWSGRYGPNRNVDGADALWIDVTGVSHLFAQGKKKRSGPGSATSSDTATTIGETELLADLQRRLSAFGLTMHAGLADTLGAAHALARFATIGARKLTIIAPPGETRAAIALLPVDALRLDPEVLLLLRRFGLKRIGDLYGLPRTALERRFRDKTVARSVLRRLDQALGHAAEPRNPITEPPILSVRRSYAEPLIVAEAIEAEIETMAVELSQRLAAMDQGVRRFALSLYRTDASTATISAGTSRPSRDPNHVLALVRDKLATLDAGFGIDAMGLDAISSERLDAHQTALVSAGPGGTHRDNLGLLIDRLSNRLGSAQVFKLQPRNSHQPEHAEICVPALVAGDLSEVRNDPWICSGKHTPHPPFLLSRPEPISVIAEVPEGAPVHFTWRRLAHRIVKAEGPERIAPEWWREISGPPAASAARSIRDYYRLEDEMGGRYWVFRANLYQDESDEDEGDAAGESPSWYMHGLFP